MRANRLRQNAANRGLISEKTMQTAVLAYGADVFATGSAASQAYIKRLGAMPIDYRAIEASDAAGKIVVDIG
jgi:hypothetical protein